MVVVAALAGPARAAIPASVHLGAEAGLGQGGAQRGGGMAAADIVVCSMPFCTDTGSRPQANQQFYADAAEDAAASVGAAFADIFALTLATPSYISADTVHPTTAGHAAIATAISAVL